MSISSIQALKNDVLQVTSGLFGQLHNISTTEYEKVFDIETRLREAGAYALKVRNNNLISFQARLLALKDQMAEEEYNQAHDALQELSDVTLAVYSATIPDSFALAHLTGDIVGSITRQLPLDPDAIVEAMVHVLEHQVE